ncbi:AP-3 complex subunit beta-A isoform X1 [Tanacetum coccineum]|uniref:AP-3 complex subunit beta-A isoform X1 n=1 Tax=Tanacetum coccineum TaxID=301880 RepID=A0ABQ5BYD0_9ASTR
MILENVNNNVGELVGPDKYVSRSCTTHILSSDYDSSQFTSSRSDDDVKILLQCTSPLLWSQNSVVVLVSAGVHWIMGPIEDISKTKNYISSIYNASQQPCVGFCNSHPFGSLAQNKGLTVMVVKLSGFTGGDVAFEAIALIIREVFVKLLLDSFGKLSIRKQVVGFARFYFDFSMTYIRARMICSHLVNLSLLAGALLSYGVMWPLIGNTNAIGVQMPTLCAVTVRI